MHGSNLEDVCVAWQSEKARARFWKVEILRNWNRGERVVCTRSCVIGAGVLSSGVWAFGQRDSSSNK